MSYPRHPHDDYESQTPEALADQPVVAPLAIPPELENFRFGPDVIIRTNGPTVIGPCNGFEAAPDEEVPF